MDRVTLGWVKLRGVTSSCATRSHEIKLDDITRCVKNQSREICETELLFVACGGSNAPLLHLACQNLKEKEKKKKRRGSSHKLCSKSFPITVIVNHIGCSPFYIFFRILSG